MKLKTYLLPLLVLAIFSACKPSIKRYSAEMEDSVRFQLAICSSVPKIENWADILQWISNLSEMSDKMQMDGKSYRDALVELSANEKFYNEVLERYDSIEVILSEPVELEPGRVWTFYEINSNINFIFTLIPTQNGDVFYKCTANEEQLTKLLQSKFWGSALDLFQQ